MARTNDAVFFRATRSPYSFSLRGGVSSPLAKLRALGCNVLEWSVIWVTWRWTLKTRIWLDHLFILFWVALNKAKQNKTKNKTSKICWRRFSTTDPVAPHGWGRGYHLSFPLNASASRLLACIRFHVLRGWDGWCGIAWSANPAHGWWWGGESTGQILMIFTDSRHDSPLWYDPATTHPSVCVCLPGQDHSM